MGLIDNLIKFDSQDLPSSFVSIATKIEDNIPTHAAILIRHESINYLHHFPGGDPPIVEENFSEDGWYVYKILDAVNTDDASEVGSVLHFCKKICENSNITYSYIADGSSYTNRGEFISKIGLPELGTCVGFCVNTLTKTILDTGESYFVLEDWDDSEIIPWVDNWSVNQVDKKYPDMDWVLYNAFKKRISPLDYLCSSFISEYPISKADVTELHPAVQDKITDLFE